jgi:glycolate oxidase FAD binding subunit
VVTTIDGIDIARTEHPATFDEVRRVVREVGDARRSLVASGLGGHLDVGGRPVRVDTLLSVDRLARIVDHQAADMTVTVESGCSLARLDETLRAADQWLPLDPPRFERTTVGGLIAANLSGPLRASQGTVRDLLIGLRVVDGEGRLVAGGGRVVKNVAGYDLPKLHVGALGTLGVLVEATFKVRPRPMHESAMLFHAASAADAVRIALAGRDALDPLWLEVRMRDGQWATAIGLGGIEAEVVAAGRRLETIASHATTGEWITDGTSLRRELATFGVEPATAVLRASVLPTDVAWVIDRVRALAPVPIAAEPASGVVRARLDDGTIVARLVETLRPEIRSRGGFLVVERASMAVKADVDVWGHPGEGFDLMRRVKAAFDPRGVFASGRFVGGL